MKASYDFDELVVILTAYPNIDYGAIANTASLVLDFAAFCDASPYDLRRDVVEARGITRPDSSPPGRLGSKVSVCDDCESWEAGRRYANSV